MYSICRGHGIASLQCLASTVAARIRKRRMKGNFLCSCVRILPLSTLTGGLRELLHATVLSPLTNSSAVKEGHALNNACDLRLSVGAALHPLYLETLVWQVLKVEFITVLDAFRVCCRQCWEETLLLRPKTLTRSWDQVGRERNCWFKHSSLCTEKSFDLVAFP